LTFNISLADTVRLVPINFGFPDAAIRQPDRAESFELSPPPSSAARLQVCILTDRSVDGDRFDVRQVAHQLEVHIFEVTAPHFVWQGTGWSRTAKPPIGNRDGGLGSSLPNQFVELLRNQFSTTILESQDVPFRSDPGCSVPVFPTGIVSQPCGDDTIVLQRSFTFHESVHCDPNDQSINCARPTSLRIRQLRPLPASRRHARR